MKTQMSPARATLLHSPGHKPWGIIVNILIEPLQGRHYSRQKQMLAPKVPLLRSSYFLCPCLPRVSFRALPSFHPGLCRSVVPTALVISLNFDTVTLRLQTTNRIQRSSPPSLSSVAPSELKICVNAPNPGFAPWAMKMYRPLGALCQIGDKGGERNAVLYGSIKE